MKKRRIHLRSFRREQIVDAAVAIIAEQGIQHLSLSEIEKKTGLVRGQLTYYFKTKEDILLAMFARLLEWMRDWTTAADCHGHVLRTMPQGWERACCLLTLLLLQPAMTPTLCSLQYTFLAEVNSHEDFRVRLAKLYDDWRNHLAEDFAPELANKKTGQSIEPKLFASLVQAILYGLTAQRAAGLDDYDREEMLTLIVDLLGNYLRPPQAAPSAKKRAPRHGAAGNGHRRTTTASPKGQPS